MKFFIRAIAAVMLIAVAATMFAACGKDNKKEKAEETVYYDDVRIENKWVSDTEGDDTTWTFYNNDTFTLTGGPNKLDIKGTYHILSEEGVHLEIVVDGEDKPRRFTYTPTETNIIINGFDFAGEDVYSFSGKKVTE